MFKYATRAWKSILTLSREPYLSHLKTEEHTSLREELIDLVGSHGVDKESVGKVWLVTMPTYLGITGINPLTVWYLYDKGRKEEALERSTSRISSDEEWVKSGFEEDRGGSNRKDESDVARGTIASRRPVGEVKPKLICVVLEVHNTFGERHAYVLRVDHNEVPRDDIAAGLNHAWVFPRTFHVSPFNNRKGYYRLDIADPFAADGARPTVRVTLSLLTKAKKRKLYAVLANNPSDSRPALELTPRNVLKAIIWRQPLDLLLTSPRILRQAWILHYEKKLRVYPRPELALRKDHAEIEIEKPWNEVEEDDDGVGRSIGWKSVGMAEKAAAGLVKRYLDVRTKTLGKSISIYFDNPERETMDIGGNTGDRKALPDLVIRTRHPAFFTKLLLAPTPEHIILSAKVDHHTVISSPELFSHIFAGSPRLEQVPVIDAWLLNFGTTIRRNYNLFLCSYCQRPIPPNLVTRFTPHWSARAVFSTFQLLLLNYVMLITFYADVAEEWVMYRMAATFVEGQAPWEGMVRIVDDVWGRKPGASREAEMDEEFGSVFSW